MFLSFAPAWPSFCRGGACGRVKVKDKSKQVPTALCSAPGPWHPGWEIEGNAEVLIPAGVRKEQSRVAFKETLESQHSLSRQQQSRQAQGGQTWCSPRPPTRNFHRCRAQQPRGRRVPGGVGRQDALTSDRPPRSSVSCPLSLLQLVHGEQVHQLPPATCCAA